MGTHATHHDIETDPDIDVTTDTEEWQHRDTIADFHPRDSDDERAA